MGSFANLADLKVIEGEQPWAARDVARSMHDYVSRARAAHGEQADRAEHLAMVGDRGEAALQVAHALDVLVHVVV